VVSGNDTAERIGGIRALDSLIDFKGDDAGQKTTRFASYLRAVLRSNDTTAMILAARALGRLATPGGTLTAELVEAEVKSCLEYLQVERNENRRFAAVLVLRELARNSPTLLYTWIPQILQVIWAAVRDPKVLIRESAAEAMSACFSILTPRDITARNQMFNRVYAETKAGFNVNSVESVHGSILVLRELIHKGGMFMQGEKYKEACNIIQKYLESRDPLIRREVTNIVPSLAVYSPQDFVQLYLHQFIMHLQGQLRAASKGNDRDASFIAIGKIANAVGSPISPYLDNILLHIREGLSLKK
jgi:serine/threonine-protein kinase mTOR